MSHPRRPRGSPGASIRLTFWKLSGESRYPGALLHVLENFRRAFSLGATDRPWVSEEVECYKVTFSLFSLLPGMNIVKSMQLSLVMPKANSEICAYWNLYATELGITPVHL